VSGTAVPIALVERWRALWRRIGGEGDGAAELADLAARYGESGRHYHTLEHVADCLAELDRERATADHADEVELALWLHDAVYDPRASDNETRSAELAARMLAAATLPPDALERISAGILATTHAAPAPPGDAALVCDADLAILGAENGRYRRYAEQIAAEYAWVPAAVFRQRRALVLRRLLDRRSIYSTNGFRERLEPAARRNLSAELSELER
jgi:predicted metal-dependent HD superfamily phosphohydrolase